MKLHIFVSNSLYPLLLILSKSLLFFSKEIWKSVVGSLQLVSWSQRSKLWRKYHCSQILDAISKKLQRPDALFSGSLANYGWEEPAPQCSLKPNAIPEPSTKLLMAAVISAKREKELCSNCDKRISYLMMIAEEEELFAAQKAVEFGILEVESNMVHTVKEVHKFWKLINAQEVTNLENSDIRWRDSGQIDDVFILCGKSNKEDIPPDLQAILRNVGITAMRVVEEVQDHKLNILLDTSNTLTFLQEDIYKTCGCTIFNAKLLMVRVAPGQKLFSTNRAIIFKSTVQGSDADKDFSQLKEAMSSTSVSRRKGCGKSWRTNTDARGK